MKSIPPNLPRIEAWLVFASALMTSLCYQGLHFESLTEMSQYLATLLLFTGITVVTFAGYGLYQYSLIKASVERMPRLVMALFTIVIITSVVGYFAPGFYIGRVELLTVFAVSFTAVTILRKAISLATSQDSSKKKVLILGAGRKALQLDQVLGNNNDHMEIVGFVHQPGEREFIDTKKVLYSVSSLEEYVNDNAIDEIVVAVDERRNGFPLKKLLTCRLHGTVVTDLLGFYERECGQIKLGFLDQGWLVFSEGFRTNPNYEKIKRYVDCFYSATYLFMSYPVYLTVNALWHICGHRGTPLLVTEEAVGQAGKTFTKLTYNPEVQETAFATAISMLKLGNFPEMRAVYRGDMSLVGPAIDSVEQAKVPLAEIAYYEERFLLKPGVHSWDKVSNPNTGAASKAERLQYDLYYVKNKSFYLDLIILMQGVRARATTALTATKGVLPINHSLSTEK